jgi:hypothetical protein
MPFEKMIQMKKSNENLFAFLQSKQQTTTRTRSMRQTEDIDQKAIWRGESGSHQN